MPDTRKILAAKLSSELPKELLTDISTYRTEKNKLNRVRPIVLPTPAPPPPKTIEERVSILEQKTKALDNTDDTIIEYLSYALNMIWKLQARVDELEASTQNKINQLSAEMQNLHTQSDQKINNALGTFANHRHNYLTPVFGSTLIPTGDGNSITVMQPAGNTQEQTSFAI